MHQVQPEEVESFRHVGRGVNQPVENKIPGADIEETETNNDQAHYRTGAEGHLKAAVE